MNKKTLSLLLLPLVLITSCGPIRPSLSAGLYVVKSFDKNFEHIDITKLKLIVEDTSNEGVFLDKLTYDDYIGNIKGYELEDLDELSNPEYRGYLVSYKFKDGYRTTSKTNDNYVDYRFVGTQISQFPPIFGYEEPYNKRYLCYEILPSYVKEMKLKTGYKVRTSSYWQEKDKNKKTNITFEIDLLNYIYDENDKYAGCTVTETSKVVFVES